VSVKNLESRLVLTADPTPMIAGINKASTALSQLGRLAGVYGGGFAGFLGVGTATSVFSALSEFAERSRELATTYTGIAASAKASADNAALMRDIEAAKFNQIRAATYEIARGRMAKADQAMYQGQGTLAGVNAADAFSLSRESFYNATGYAVSRSAMPSSGAAVTNPGMSFMWDFVSSLSAQRDAVGSGDEETLKGILDEIRKANATGGGG